VIGGFPSRVEALPGDFIASAIRHSGRRISHDRDRELAEDNRAGHEQERGMSDLIARTTGLPGLTCDLAQLSIGDGGALLELIAFRGIQSAY